MLRVITQKEFDELQDEFGMYWYESGAYYELDADYDEREFNWISDQLGTDEWEVEDNA